MSEAKEGEAEAIIADYREWAERDGACDPDYISRGNMRTLLAHIDTLQAERDNALAGAADNSDWAGMAEMQMREAEARAERAEARVSELEEERKDIEAAVREFCPTENTETPDYAPYICMGDGDPIIEAETLAEAIRGAHKCWDWCEKALDDARAEIGRMEDTPTSEGA